MFSPFSYLDPDSLSSVRHGRKLLITGKIRPFLFKGEGFFIRIFFFRKKKRKEKKRKTTEQSALCPL